MIVVTSIAGQSTAARIQTALADTCPEIIPTGADSVALGQTLQTLTHDQAGIVVGTLDVLLSALAPRLVDPAQRLRSPIVLVTPDGASVIAISGVAQGVDALARQIATALGVRAVTLRPVPEHVDAAPARTTGRLAVIGLGPGAPEWMAPAVRDELTRAQDIIGYTTYVRLAGIFRPDQRILDSDNRCELERARLAFELAAQGRQVVVVSSGDPGVFAMAAAVMEALDCATNSSWHSVELAILPGISAAQAVAAKSGAPLGHDFCVLSLSDNLKPWSQIERRLEYAALADLVIALYNPSSKARPWQLGQALERLRHHRRPETPVVLGRDVGRSAEQITVTTLDGVRPEQVDMRTLVIIGSSQTRRIRRPDGTDWVYTPRWYPGD